MRLFSFLGSGCGQGLHHSVDDNIYNLHSMFLRQLEILFVEHVDAVNHLLNQLDLRISESVLVRYVIRAAWKTRCQWRTKGHLGKPSLYKNDFLWNNFVNRGVGGFLFRKFWNFKFCMLPNCAHLLTDFRTVFVFALGPFLPMFVIFFRVWWEF